MYTKQSNLKNILTNMIETLTPEVEKEFADYIESTTVRDKAIDLFGNISEFLGSVADTVGIPDDSYQVASDEFLDKIKSNSISPFFYQLALYHDLKNYDQKVETFEHNLATNDDESSSPDHCNALIVNQHLDVETFNIIPDVSITTYPPVYNDDRKSITIVIDYPTSFCECGDDYEICPGYFTLSVEVDEINPKPKHLYYSTLREVWEDEQEFNEPIVFSLAENSQKGGK